MLAQRGSILGMGTDSAGSIRVPASFCGVCGLRTTGYRLRYLVLVQGEGETQPSLGEQRPGGVEGPAWYINSYPLTSVLGEAAKCRWASNSSCFSPRSAHHVWYRWQEKRPSTCSLIYLFMNSFIFTSIHRLTCSLSRSLVYPFFHLSILCPFIHLCTHHPSL